MHRIMAVEQRSKQRDLTSFTIELHGQNSEIIDCRALNLSVSGMLLDYDGTDLTIGSNINIFVRFKEHELEIPAAVIHCNSSCIGIMFRQPQPDLYRAVTGSMRSAHLSINSRTPISFVA